MLRVNRLNVYGLGTNVLYGPWMTRRPTGGVEHVQCQRSSVQLVITAVKLLNGRLVLGHEALVQKPRDNARLSDGRRTHHHNPIAVLGEQSLTPAGSGRLQLGRARLRPSLWRLFIGVDGCLASPGLLHCRPVNTNAFNYVSVRHVLASL